VLVIEAAGEKQKGKKQEDGTPTGPSTQIRGKNFQNESEKEKNIDWSHEGLTSVGNIEKGVRRFQTGPQAGPTVWNVNELLATAENRQGEIRCKAKEANDHNEMNGK